MYLVETFLPIRGRDGSRIPAAEFEQLRREFLERFGGLTEFSRVPAKGYWKPGEADGSEEDDIVVFEVMTQSLERGWWSSLRKRLEERFEQEAVLIRTQLIELL